MQGVLQSISKRLFSTSNTRYKFIGVASLKDPIHFEEPDLEQVRNQARQHEGGQVVLTTDEKNGIAYICIDHAQRKNAFSGKMMVDLNDCVNELEKWTTGKGVILHANGNSFCSGGYLETVKKICNHQDGYRMATLMHDSVIRLRRLPMVSVTLVNGLAIGGGAELILSTDFRAFTPNSEVAYVEARMGVGTGWAGGYLLRQLLGHQKALDLLLTCRKIKADEALRLGLADVILEDENSLKSTSDWLSQKVSRLDAKVLQTMKSIVFCRDLIDEKQLFANTWGGPAQLEALNKNIKHK